MSSSLGDVFVDYYSTGELTCFLIIQIKDVSEFLLTNVLYYRTRKVTKEAMVIFRKCRYSVDPRYIGKDVDLDLSENEAHVHIYYNGERIRSHLLTTKRLNYNHDDLVQILKSDVMSHKEEDDIQKHIKQSLKQYDLLEVPSDE